MRLIIFILLSLFVNSVIAQTSVVYKRNPATSVLEVYQSSGGLPVGSPIYKIKKNVYGYLEVEDVQVSNDPFTLKPDYKAYNNFKPYQLPAKEIFETLETLNKRIEYDRFVSNPPKQNSNLVLDRLNANIDSRTRTATAFLKFYSSFIKFPETLKDGWYNVTKIEESASLDNLGIKGGTDFKYGICKVTKNKVVEYYENIHVLDSKESNVFVKVSLALSSNVTNCKATVKRNDFNNYETIYFLDNLVDAETQAENPGFSYYSIFTPPDLIKPGHVIYIKRNESITVAEVSKGEGFPYLSILGVNNASSYPCNSSLMTLAFKKIKVSSYSVGIMNLSDQRIWLVNQIRFNSIGTCQSTILSTQ